ncbi:hypothetical protein DFP73DRAFT_620859, partial [Morchella snyderi]
VTSLQSTTLHLHPQCDLRATNTAKRSIQAPNMAPRRKNNKSRTQKEKDITPRKPRKTLSQYILTENEIGALHCLSDASKILHGFTEMEFAVENSCDVVEDEETRKESARIIRRLKAVRPGHPTIRRKARPGKRLPGLHTETLELRVPIHASPAVLTTSPTPTPENEKLSSTPRENEAIRSRVTDQGEESHTLHGVAEEFMSELKNSREPRVTMQTTATFQCRVCDEWFYTGYQKKVHQWDKHNMRHVRLQEGGQVYSCGGKI